MNGVYFSCCFLVCVYLVFSYVRILEDAYRGLLECYRAGPNEGWELAGEEK